MKGNKKKKLYLKSTLRNCRTLALSIFSVCRAVYTPLPIVSKDRMRRKKISSSSKADDHDNIACALPRLSTVSLWESCAQYNNYIIIRKRRTIVTLYEAVTWEGQLPPFLYIYMYVKKEGKGDWDFE